MERKPRLGFIGLGLMGSRMARRLLAAGYSMTVYNRTAEKAAPLVEAGAHLAGSPREAAALSDVVLSILADDAAVEAMSFGPNGMIVGLEPRSALIELSTCSPALGRRLAGAAHERNAYVLEGAVSGSTPQAEKGDLVISVGGDRSAYDGCQVILMHLGRAVYCGDAGTGKAANLVMNAMLGAGLQALAEALALGLKAGLDQDTLFEILGDIGVISPSQRSKFENARRGEYPVTFPLRLMQKDYRLVLDEAQALAVPMPATAVAAQMGAAEMALGTEEDFSAVIRLMLRLAGIGE